MAQSTAAARVAFLIGDATSAAGRLGAATNHHLASGGRGWRSRLAVDCAAILGVAWQDAAALAAACELVHQASIVHDDVQDNTALRRGRPSVAARYGAATAICVGDHMLTAAFGVLAGLPNAPGLIRLFTTRVSEMVAGQADEFSPRLWPDMTLEQYRGMAGGKAGAAVTLPIEGAALLSGMPELDVLQANGAGRALGMAYQASDDVVDIEADLRRGALNGVLAHALDSASIAGRAELLVSLEHGRTGDLGHDEARRVAAQLRPAAHELTAWACDLLTGLDREMARHRLGPVLMAAAAELRSRLAATASVQLDAA